MKLLLIGVTFYYTNTKKKGLFYVKCIMCVKYYNI